MNTREFCLSAWSWSLGPLLAAVVALAVYLVLFRRRLALRSAFFFAGAIVFLLTLVSPLETLAQGYLFSAHVTGHVMLLLIVPALALLGLPAGVTRRSSAPLEVGARALLYPALAWLGGVGAMWLWHEPNLCSAAATPGPVRLVQIVSLLGLGTLFWSPILRPDAARRLSPPAGMVYLFAACLGCTVLGIIITFAPVSVCPAFAHPKDPLGILPLIRGRWGITPALDQQVGGLLMWVPSCSIYVAAILGLLARWYEVSLGDSRSAPRHAENPAGAGHSGPAAAEDGRAPAPN